MKKKYYIVVNILCSMPVMELVGGKYYNGYKVLVGGDNATLFKTRKEANDAIRETHAYAKQDEYISKSKRTLRLWTSHKVYPCVVEE